MDDLEFSFPARDQMRRSVLLVIGGGIAAYKCLDLVRRLSERGYRVPAIMTEAAQQFVTPLSVSALSNDRVFTNLFDLDDEHEIGHIRLSRDCDAVIVAPATADLMAKMAGGHANDLATAVLLATDRPVLVAPAMNPRMWSHPATQRNVAQLRADDVTVIEPEIGEMAESDEFGQGRLPKTAELVSRIEQEIRRSDGKRKKTGSLTGRHVLITSGPTHEPIDPVRFVANRSSGKQGHAIAAAAARAGAKVTLISGPVSIPDPEGVTCIHVETAQEMLSAVEEGLPADIAIFAAAVADWRVDKASRHKIKKRDGNKSLDLTLSENPDILATVARKKRNRPALVVGFAAETQSVTKSARKKRQAKAADWIVANDVSPGTGIMGGDRNTVHLVTWSDTESWPEMSKDDVADRLIKRAAAYFEKRQTVKQ